MIFHVVTFSNILRLCLVQGFLKIKNCKICQHGFKTYMGVTPTISGWSASGDEFSLVMDVNPLIEFVEMPSDGSHAQLRYSQVICGAIRGALEMVRVLLLVIF